VSQIENIKKDIISTRNRILTDANKELIKFAASSGKIANGIGKIAMVDLNDNDLNISFYMDDSDTKAARSITPPSCPPT